MCGRPGPLGKCLVPGTSNRYVDGLASGSIRSRITLVALPSNSAALRAISTSPPEGSLVLTDEPLTAADATAGLSPAGSVVAVGPVFPIRHVFAVRTIPEKMTSASATENPVRRPRIAPQILQVSCPASLRCWTTPITGLAASWALWSRCCQQTERFWRRTRLILRETFDSERALGFAHCAGVCRRTAVGSGRATTWDDDPSG